MDGGRRLAVMGAMRRHHEAPTSAFPNYRRVAADLRLTSPCSPTLILRSRVELLTLDLNQIAEGISLIQEPGKFNLWKEADCREHLASIPQSASIAELHHLTAWDLDLRHPKRQKILENVHDEENNDFSE